MPDLRRPPGYVYWLMLTCALLTYGGLMTASRNVIIEWPAAADDIESPLMLAAISLVCGVFPLIAWFVADVLERLD